MAFVPAPGYQPTYNPTLPYCKPIPGGLSVGMSVYIQGVASDHMKRASAVVWAREPWDRAGGRGLPGGGPPAPGGGTRGTSPSCPARFSVNFLVGQDPGSDIAFHFNPRFDGLDKVVFNTLQGGKWGSEEKKRSMPFKKGTAFELVIMVLAEHYKVVVNGNPFYEYGHRLPLQMVTHLQVDGDLQLQSINFIGGQQPPPPQV
ncbi:Galectin-4 [Saguinus oedipus]|uniref:Galectin n=1 Tax=Saguinus oedipus TaxID=9490 RepID=A0ABQ9TUB1_SAGOE|nr:Galectin-4 [Saguinus oedipus]